MRSGPVACLAAEGPGPALQALGESFRAASNLAARRAKRCAEFSIGRYVGTRLPRRDRTLARLLGAALVACGLWTAVAPIAALSGAATPTHGSHALTPLSGGSTVPDCAGG